MDFIWIVIIEQIPMNGNNCLVVFSPFDRYESFLHTHARVLLMLLCKMFSRSAGNTQQFPTIISIKKINRISPVFFQSIRKQITALTYTQKKILVNLIYQKVKSRKLPWNVSWFTLFSYSKYYFVEKLGKWAKILLFATNLP